MTQTHFMFVFLLISVALLAFGSCERGIAGSDVPAQTYSSALGALGEDSGVIEGQVLFPSEYAQRSVVLHIGKLPFVTQPDGRFRIIRVPVGTHDFRISAIGFEPIKLETRVNAEVPTVMDGVRLNMARGRVIGRLVHLDGDSARGISMRLEPSGANTETASDGTFQFVGVPGGHHEMLLDHPAFYTKALRFALPSGQTQDLGVLNVFRRAGSPADTLTSGRDLR